MKKIGILAIVAAATAAALVFGYSEFGGVKPEQTSVAPVEKPQLKTRSLKYKLTQQETSTVCETPSGDVCDVDPSPINSECNCDGSVGRIVN